MKKLLIAAMLIAGPACAEEWWEGPNESGGKIVLLETQCTPHPDATTMRRMYAVHKKGMTYWGCWNFWSGQVHVVYDDGASYTYTPELFERKVSK